jgi:glycosyltransferase involved in cell wall biosynthesis
MKVIVSAIACTPGGGSEGGVGWRAVLRIAKYHDVRVITQEMNRPYWDQAALKGELPDNVRVRYLDCGGKWHSNRMVARIQSWTRYVKFSRSVLAEANAWHQQEPADLVHQITYATWRVPSRLWQMPIPFVWGPVGGTAVFPKKFFSILGKTSLFFEIAREFSGRISARSPSFTRCATNSAVVLAANDETFAFLKPFREGKPLLKLPVAHLTEEQIIRFRRPPRPMVRGDAPLRLFAGGNIGGSKGVSLALRAVARMKEAGTEVHYTVAGGGPEMPTLKKLAWKLGINHSVTFHPGYKGKEYIEALQNSDIYFLPSFRETTPVTLLEAALAGCVPIVADASAAGEMAKLIGGHAVPVNSPEELVSALADAVIHLHFNRPELESKSKQVASAAADMYSGERYDQITESAYIAATNTSNLSPPTS